jgi:hypothetical protein
LSEAQNFRVTPCNNGAPYISATLGRLRSPQAFALKRLRLLLFSSQAQV